MTQLRVRGDERFEGERPEWSAVAGHVSHDRLNVGGLIALIVYYAVAAGLTDYTRVMGIPPGLRRTPWTWSGFRCRGGRRWVAVVVPAAGDRRATAVSGAPPLHVENRVSGPKSFEKGLLGGVTLRPLKFFADLSGYLSGQKARRCWGVGPLLLLPLKILERE